VKRLVQWSRHALDDLKNQIAYIAADNPHAARQVADKIGATATVLGDMATGRSGRVGGAYEKPVIGLPDVIAHAITRQDAREAVSILRAIHAARDWRDGEWPT